jgi:hypothetical protein
MPVPESANVMLMEPRGAVVSGAVPLSSQLDYALSALTRREAQVGHQEVPEPLAATLQRGHHLVVDGLNQVDHPIAHDLSAQEL